MGPEQTEIRIHASKATVPSNDFYNKDHFIYILYCTNCVYTVYIFLPCRFKKTVTVCSALGICNCVFIIGPVSMIGNMYVEQRKSG
jgi:hypothetical protein